MPRQSQTVRALADNADLDYEIALLTLWEAGLHHIDDIDAVIPSRHMRVARDALAVPSPSVLKTVQYWCDTLGMSEHDFREHALGLGIQLSERSRTLPKGAIKKLRRANGKQPAVALSLERAAQERRREERTSVSPSDDVPPPLKWESVGRPRELQHLDIDEVLAVHEALAKDFARSADPIEPAGVRSEQLLDSAVHRPMTSLGQESKYPSAEMAAAALLHSIIHNHPFHNGNKRTGLVAMLCLLDRNNVVLTCSEKEVFRFVLRVAQHGLVDTRWDMVPDREVLEIAQWIRSNSRRIEKGERPIKWHELRRILSSFDCVVEPAGGNRVTITRHFAVRGRFRRKRQPLRTHTHYASEGREVERSQLNQIRGDLELDEEHGYDSAIFYRGERQIDEFIDMYRKTLERLAKL